MNGGNSLVGHARMSGEKGYRPEKNKTTADSPIMLVGELRVSKSCMNECNMYQRATLIQQARYAVTS